MVKRPHCTKVFFIYPQAVRTYHGWVFLKVYPESVFRIVFLLALNVLKTRFLDEKKGGKKSSAGGMENTFLEMKNELHGVLK